MTEPVQEKERAAFEAWVKHELLDGGLINLEREEGGEYSHSAANLAWEVWQAACASEGRRETTPEPSVDDTLRLLRKISLCEGDAAKLILMKHFYEAAYRRGRAEQAKECLKIVDDAVQEINGRAQIYSLTAKDEKSFALNNQRLGAMDVASALREKIKP